MKGIYFWDYIAVAQRLHRGDFSEADALKQLIALFVISGVSIPVPMSVFVVSVYTPVAFDIFMYVLSGVMSYIGFWWVYQSHVKAQGRDFFLKLAALELPIGLRLFILTILPLMLISIPLLQIFPSQWFARGVGLFIAIVGAVVHFKMLKKAVCYSEYGRF